MWILRQRDGVERLFRQFDELLAFEGREIHELRITWLCGQRAGSNKNNDGDSPERGATDVNPVDSKLLVDGI